MAVEGLRTALLEAVSAEAGGPWRAGALGSTVTETTSRRPQNGILAARVESLRKFQPGTRVSYAEIALRIG